MWMHLCPVWRIFMSYPIHIVSRYFSMGCRRNSQFLSILRMLSILLIPFTQLANFSSHGELELALILSFLSLVSRLECIVQTLVCPDNLFVECALGRQSGHSQSFCLIGIRQLLHAGYSDLKSKGSVANVVSHIILYIIVLAILCEYAVHG